MNWLINQITNFNVLMFISIVIFNSILGRANMTKLLKEQSQELYNDFEEIKDEVRGKSNRANEKQEKQLRDEMLKIEQQNTTLFMQLQQEIQIAKTDLISEIKETHAQQLHSIDALHAQQNKKER